MVWGSCDANMGQLVTGMTLLARERNHTSEYRRERVRRQTIAEGAFASLDRMGWARSRLRGLRKVDCEGYMAFLRAQCPQSCAQTGTVDRTCRSGLSKWRHP